MEEEVRAINFRQLRQEMRRQAALEQARKRQEQEKQQQQQTQPQQHEKPTQEKTTETSNGENGHLSMTRKEWEVKLAETPLLSPHWNLPPIPSSSAGFRLDPHRLTWSTSVFNSLPPRHVYYTPHFLHPDYIQHILLPWLHAQPEVQDDQHGLPEREVAQKCHGKWKRLPHAQRRVMLLDFSSNHHQRTKTTKNNNNNNNSKSDQMPTVLEPIVQALAETGIFSSSDDHEHQTTPRPNHVLINEYQPGMGILPHTDGPEYHDTTATLSVGGSDVVFGFTPRLQSHEINNKHNSSIDDSTNMSCCSKEGKNTTKAKWQVVLHGGGSLVVFRQDAYRDYLHSIVDGVRQEWLEYGPHQQEHLQQKQGCGMIRRGYRISLTFRIKKNKG